MIIETIRMLSEEPSVLPRLCHFQNRFPDTQSNPFDTARHISAFPPCGFDQQYSYSGYCRQVIRSDEASAATTAAPAAAAAATAGTSTHTPAIQQHGCFGAAAADATGGS